MIRTYYTQTNEPIQLAEEIGKGGEGSVYAVEGRGSECAKIYDKPASAETANKLLVMVASPPDDPTWVSQQHHSIAWPLAVLYPDQRKSAMAGFLMPRINLASFRTLLNYITPEDRGTVLAGKVSWKTLYCAALNLASVVAAIHKRGSRIGDLNESNILIGSNALVTLIDCDSFQVTDSKQGKTYRCQVGKPEYTALELQRKAFKDHDRTEETDTFALAVLLFQLLMEGLHPYAGRGRLVEHAPSTQAKLLLGHFPYVKNRAGIEPPAFAPSFDILPLSLQQLFLRCFVAGHKAPQSRPTAKEWYGALNQHVNAFIKCGKNPDHLYLPPRISCPWCELAMRLGSEPYPRAGADEMHNAARMVTLLRNPASRSSGSVAVPPAPRPLQPPMSRSSQFIAQKKATRAIVAVLCGVAVVFVMCLWSAQPGGQVGAERPEEVKARKDQERRAEEEHQRELRGQREEKERQQLADEGMQRAQQEEQDRKASQRRDAERLKADEENANLAVKDAKTLIKQNQSEKAEALLKKVVDDFPATQGARDAAKVLAEMAEELASDYLEYARRLIDEGEDEKALKCLKNIGRDLPGTQGAREAEKLFAEMNRPRTPEETKKHADEQARKHDEAKKRQAQAAKEKAEREAKDAKEKADTYWAEVKAEAEKAQRKAEEAAIAKLKIAKRLLRDADEARLINRQFAEGKRLQEGAYDILRQLVKEYPNTKAADEARELLK